tara:strand:- start:55594 stop:55884 length:291 start_codon:yes stop_codon:yes gene_type:complete
MLEIRPTCENCKTKLAPDSNDARICSFECTYCQSCAEDVFKNVCPNCGGGFVPRPIRPKKMLMKYPASNVVVEKPLDVAAFEALCKDMINIHPSKR